MRDVAGALQVISFLGCCAACVLFFRVYRLTGKWILAPETLYSPRVRSLEHTALLVTGIALSLGFVSGVLEYLDKGEDRWILFLNVPIGVFGSVTALTSLRGLLRARADLAAEREEP